MLNVSFRIKQDKAELEKQKMTVTSVAVATTKSLFGLCDCTLDSDVGKGDMSPVQDILLVRGYVSQGMGCLSMPSCLVFLGVLNNTLHQGWANFSGQGPHSQILSFKRPHTG